MAKEASEGSSTSSKASNSSKGSSAKKREKRAKAAERVDWRFLPESTTSSRIVYLLGFVGALALGAGTYAQFGRDGASVFHDKAFWFFAGGAMSVALHFGSLQRRGCASSWRAWCCPRKWRRTPHPWYSRIARLGRGPRGALRHRQG